MHISRITPLASFPVAGEEPGFAAMQIGAALTGQQFTIDAGVPDQHLEPLLQ
jgi:hypothetical protein